MWKFFRKAVSAKFWAVRYAENVPFHKISTPGIRWNHGILRSTKCTRISNYLAYVRTKWMIHRLMVYLTLMWPSGRHVNVLRQINLGRVSPWKYSCHRNEGFSEKGMEDIDRRNLKKQVQLRIQQQAQMTNSTINFRTVRAHHLVRTQNFPKN